MSDHPLPPRPPSLSYSVTLPVITAPAVPPVPRRRDSLLTLRDKVKRPLVVASVTTMSQVETLLDDPHPAYTFEAKSLSKESFRVLNEFYQKKLLCDVELKVGQKSFRCHRVVLACVSRYFRTMFTSEMAESRKTVIPIQDIEEKALEQLINFAYTAKVTLTTDTVQSLLYASSILQVETVAHACCEFMKTHLHPSNCIGIYTFAEQHGRTELMKRADQYIQDNFMAVVDSDEFLSMTFKHLESLVASTDLNVGNEEEVYQAVMKWIKHDINKRKQHLSKLISKVKLPLLPATYLMDKVATEDLLRRDMECRDFVDEAKYYQLSLAQVVPTMDLSDRIRPRKSCAGVVFCVGGRGASGDPFKSIECYDVRHNCWFQVTEMSSRRRHVGVVSIHGKLYAVGGHDGAEHLKSGEMFDPISNKWKPIAPMATLRRGIALACLGGPVYAVGGLDDSTCYNIVERYDPDSDTWSFVQAMLMPRGGVAVATLKGYLYAIGGNDGAASLDSCERYDPHLNKWTMMTSMNKRRAGAGVAELNGLLYVVGGFDDNSPLNSVERYNPIENTWMVVAKMSCPRGGVGVTALGGKIYAVGGHDGTNYLNSVEGYDPVTNIWETAANISVCRAGAGIAVVNCHIEQLKDISKVNMAPAGKGGKVCCLVKCSIYARTSVIYEESTSAAEIVHAIDST